MGALIFLWAFWVCVMLVMAGLIVHWRWRAAARRLASIERAVDRLLAELRL